ncbi:hypothetical protein HEP_00506100 [Hepatocystis sp. ex Piliocolobus tephrosceles]|nr:hypothetical protein HEP_00506100 [Hepatocystis sp. ex Piliocolobus tephrosceles]
MPSVFEYIIRNSKNYLKGNNLIKKIKNSKDIVGYSYIINNFQHNELKKNGIIYDNNINNININNINVNNININNNNINNNINNNYNKNVFFNNPGISNKRINAKCNCGESGNNNKHIIKEVTCFNNNLNSDFNNKNKVIKKYNTCNSMAETKTVLKSILKKTKSAEVGNTNEDKDKEVKIKYKNTKHVQFNTKLNTYYFEKYSYEDNIYRFNNIIIDSKNNYNRSSNSKRESLYKVLEYGINKNDLFSYDTVRYNFNSLLKKIVTFVYVYKD